MLPPSTTIRRYLMLFTLSSARIYGKVFRSYIHMLYYLAFRGKRQPRYLFQSPFFSLFRVSVPIDEACPTGQQRSRSDSDILHKTTNILLSSSLVSIARGMLYIVTVALSITEPQTWKEPWVHDELVCTALKRSYWHDVRRPPRSSF